MKKILFSTCYYINIFMLFVFFFIIIISFLDLKELSCIIKSDTFISIRFLLSIPMVVIWIWSLIIWSKFDKKIIHFFLLFFLMGFYPIIYYQRIKKNNWL